MKLSAKDRKRLLAGKRPLFEIAARENCPEGQIVLSSIKDTATGLEVEQVVLVWGQPKKKDGKWYATYVIRDTRPERLLAKTSGYVRSPVAAMRLEREGEPEAVSAEDQKKITAKSRQEFDLSQSDTELRRIARSQAGVLREVAGRAEDCGVDIKAELDAIGQHLAEARRKLAA